MAKRNRYAKKNQATAESSTETFSVGDSVRVKAGVKDPDFGGDLGGLQGRVTEIESGPPGKTTITFQWDSLSLKAMPGTYIRHCEEKGLDWTAMGLYPEEIESVDPRDTQEDVEEIIEQLNAEHAWDHLGKQGQRISQVLRGVDEDEDMAAFEAWIKYLESHLKLPLIAEVSEFQERGPLQAGDRGTVTGFESVEDRYGVLVHIQAKGETYVFPLCDLKAVDKKSANYTLTHDYAVWFANR